MAASSGDQFRGVSLGGRGAVKEPSEREQKGGIQGGKERAIREVSCEWGVRAQGVKTLGQWLRCNQNQWQCIRRTAGADGKHRLHPLHSILLPDKKKSATVAIRVRSNLL